MRKRPRTRGERNGRGACFIAIALFVASAFTALSNLLFLRNVVETNGTVVSNRKELIHDRSGELFVHYATVEFIDSLGNAHQFEPFMGKDELIPIGKTLPVLYSTGDPSKAYVGGPDYWGIPIGLAGVGAFFLAFGIFMIALSRRLVKWGVPMNT